MSDSKSEKKESVPATTWNEDAVERTCDESWNRGLESGAYMIDEHGRNFAYFRSGFRSGVNEFAQPPTPKAPEGAGELITLMARYDTGRHVMVERGYITTEDYAKELLEVLESKGYVVAKAESLSLSAAGDSRYRLKKQNAELYRIADEWRKEVDRLKAKYEPVYLTTGTMDEQPTQSPTPAPVDEVVWEVAKINSEGQLRNWKTFTWYPEALLDDPEFSRKYRITEVRRKLTKPQSDVSLMVGDVSGKERELFKHGSSFEDERADAARAQEIDFQADYLKAIRECPEETQKIIRELEKENAELKRTIETKEKLLRLEEDQHAELKAEADRLREKLTLARETIHLEFCGSDGHHPRCIEVQDEVATKSPKPTRGDG